MLLVDLSFAVLVAVMFVRRVGEYSITRPSRDMLYTSVTREERYKAKNFIDTVVYRGGDNFAAWLIGALLPVFSNLLPADRVKQPQKGAFGQITVQPRGATNTFPVAGTRATTQVNAPALAAAGIGGTDQRPATTAQNYRDFSVCTRQALDFVAAQFQVSIDAPERDIYSKIFNAMVKPAFIFDGRNILDHKRLYEIGFNVYAVGKPPRTHFHD